MNQKNQSVSFEIEIKPKNSPKSNPLIKQKLENYSEVAPSLQDIQEKLERAEKARLLEQQKKKSVDESIAKASQNREALTQQVEESLKQTKKILETKLETAEQLRSKAIDSKIQKARKQSNKIEQAHQMSILKQEEKKNRQQEKENIGLEKSQKQLEQTKLKAKTHCDKVSQVLEAHTKKQAEKIESIKTDLETKLKLAEQNRQKMLDEVVKKSRTLIEKKNSSSTACQAPQGSS